VDLSWARHAVRDLEQAGEFIARDNPSAARRLAGQVREAVEYLLKHPNLGRTGRVRATRELVVSSTPFIVIYRVRYDMLEVLRVLHHARRWP